jgi:ketosteroid isomerase-like protein
MRTTIIAAACLALGSGGLAQAAPANDAVAVAHAFIDAFNKGDLKAAGATHEADAAIIDEVGAHQWHGPGAFQAWASDLAKDAAANGDTDEKVTLGKTVRAEAQGDVAYAVIESTFTYKEKGKAMSEAAHMVYAFKKEADGWKIAGWAWSGGVPKAVTPSAPKAAAAKPTAPAPSAKSAAKPPATH